MEVAARTRHAEARPAWWAASDALLSHATGAMALDATRELAPLDPTCGGRLVDRDWAGIVYPAFGGAGIVRKEAHGSPSMSSFGPPSAPWPVTIGSVLGTAPWRWMVVRGPAPDPIFYGLLLDDPEADDPRVFVRVAERESGAVLCEGTVTIGWKPRVAECERGARSDVGACPRVRRERLIDYAIDGAIRTALWPD
jgi:hypothetical protein